MKYTSIVLLALLIFGACTDMNLNPLSEGSSENWYSNENEMNMSLNDLYREVFWPWDEDPSLNDNPWTDDWIRRNFLSSISSATINGETGFVVSRWTNAYKAIARANTLLANLNRAVGEIPQDNLDIYEAEARFVRAAQYSMLISHYGDVVFYTEILGLEESFTKTKTDKEIILDAIYDDFNFAIDKLPETRSGLNRATKGAALALNARIALYMEDWALARDAAKACMDLNIYQLYSDYGTLFLSKTKKANETIFGIPRSVALNSYLNTGWVRDITTRNVGGYGAKVPSWDLFCSYLCTDGLPIDESPLYNPREPFENRDPRCAATIVEFQTNHLGFMYQPHPDSTQVWNFTTGKYQKNNDTRSNAQYCSYNGLVLKKGVDGDWVDDLKSDPDKIIIRYADVLLMYAEAKIELAEIDQSVLDAINMVRARAYSAGLNETTLYPPVTNTDQSYLRRIVRTERRMEFALEGLRYMDIIRWKLAEKVLNNDDFGMLDVADLRTKVVNQGLWFFPGIPEIDEDGIPDFTAMHTAGLILRLADKSFDNTKQYLWPIPTVEILTNDNIEQNTGY